MTALDLSSPVAVVGTGTMGQGIAQVALVAGHPVRLYDTVPGRAREAAEEIGARLDRLVEKERLTGADRDAARARLLPAEALAELADCALVVEAVLERLDVKQDLFRELEGIVADDCLLATNTSSLSVTAIGGALRSPAASSACTSSTRRRCCRWSRSSPGSPPTSRTPRARTRPPAPGARRRSPARTPPASSSTASPGPSTPRPSRCTRHRAPTRPPSTPCCASRAASGWARSS
ncbi:hypothetical protein GCM10011428_62500 [Streptomyces violaceus]